ncbi:hypothetical protein [Brucella anthropi]|uniref:hypothetical protein n=1 Tax=Brucella anthropi TaxID=529 RepID=UPI000F692BCA|nr:hypothetical protein [Brucella anthropi]RRY03842.1 hypothetical protein EGJ58_22335 [Brucella anthropi]
MTSAVGISSNSRRLFDNVKSIVGLLFEKEEQQLVRRELEMVSKNAALGGSPDGFRHLGMIYSHLSGRARTMGQYKSLHPSLVPEMGTISTERKVLDADRAKTTQALSLVLKDAKSFQDMRDALPNCLKDIVPELRDYERTRPEAFTLADNPRSYNQYNKLKDKIDYYAAARLLY